MGSAAPREVAHKAIRQVDDARVFILWPLSGGWNSCVGPIERLKLEGDFSRGKL